MENKKNDLVKSTDPVGKAATFEPIEDEFDGEAPDDAMEVCDECGKEFIHCYCEETAEFYDEFPIDDNGGMAILTKAAYILNCAYNDHDMDTIGTVADWLNALGADVGDEKTINEINKTYDEYNEDNLDG